MVANGRSGDYCYGVICYVDDLLVSVHHQQTCTWLFSTWMQLNGYRFIRKLNRYLDCRLVDEIFDTYCCCAVIYNADL